MVFRGVAGAALAAALDEVAEVFLTVLLGAEPFGAGLFLAGAFFVVVCSGAGAESGSSGSPILLSPSTICLAMRPARPTSESDAIAPPEVAGPIPSRGP
ncbi:MAG TPA: hypothetical protein PKK40_11360 [Marmoricola sp.]|nr:hypothetical protein [Marmoricola sp.]